MKSKASEVPKMDSSMDENVKMKKPMESEKSQKSGNKIPQGGKKEARIDKHEAKEPSAGLSSMVGAGSVLHSIPENHMKSQSPVHEAAGFVSPKNY